MEKRNHKIQFRAAPEVDAVYRSTKNLFFSLTFRDYIRVANIFVGGRGAHLKKIIAANDRDKLNPART